MKKIVKYSLDLLNRQFVKDEHWVSDEKAKHYPASQVCTGDESQCSCVACEAERATVPSEVVNEEEVKRELAELEEISTLADEHFIWGHPLRERVFERMVDAERSRLCRLLVGEGGEHAQ